MKFDKVRFKWYWLHVRDKKPGHNLPEDEARRAVLDPEAMTNEKKGRLGHWITDAAGKPWVVLVSASNSVRATVGVLINAYRKDRIPPVVKPPSDDEPGERY